MYPITLYSVQQPQVVVGRMYIGSDFLVVITTNQVVATECDPDEVLFKMRRNQVWNESPITINPIDEQVILNVRNNPLLYLGFNKRKVVAELETTPVKA